MNIHTYINTELSIAYDETLINAINLFVRDPFRIIDDETGVTVERGIIDKAVVIKDGYLHLNDETKVCIDNILSLLLNNNKVTIYIG